MNKHLTTMHSPAHPGEILREWLPSDMSVTEAAQQLHISRVLLSRILNTHEGISAEMAIKLSQWLGTTAKFWMNMQMEWELWQARQGVGVTITPLLRVA